MPAPNSTACAIMNTMVKFENERTSQSPWLFRLQVNPAGNEMFRGEAELTAIAIQRPLHQSKNGINRYSLQL